jgi:glutathione synthase/RimK-type ligase-like ATP-grasp enzyme
MLVGLHCDPGGKFGSYISRFIEIMELNHIPYIKLNASDTDFWQKVATVDLFIYHWGHTDDYYELAHAILPIIENQMGIQCYPNQATCWHYDDKIKQFYLLQQHGFPVVPSYVFWERKKALQWLDTTQFPLVFKLKGGAGSASVVLVKTKRQARFLVKRMFGAGMYCKQVPGMGSTRIKFFNPYKEIRHLLGTIKRKINGEPTNLTWRLHKDYVYFQKFCPGNQWDTRVATIGKRAYAFRRFVRKNDFRASGSNSWELDRSKIDLRFVKIAHEISQLFGFQSMAYDFIYDENQNPLLIEISYTYGEPDYPDFNDGYWDTDMVWHDGYFRTRELIMEDLLHLPDLKMPEIAAHDYSHIKVK